MTVAENLRRLRSAAGLSQARLAEEANVSQQLVSQIERGENVSTKYLPQLARAIGCAVADIDPSYQSDSDLLDDPITRELARLAGKLTDVERRFLLAAAQGIVSQAHGEG
jgi:transcriptional regulator with XRE-family HTH domain